MAWNKLDSNVQIFETRKHGAFEAIYIELTSKVSIALLVVRKQIRKFEFFVNIYNS